MSVLSWLKNPEGGPRQRMGEVDRVLAAAIIGRAQAQQPSTASSDASSASYSWQKLRDVPDRVDGEYVLFPLYLK